jgi:acetyltransferase-like isoleucine patch superfamily enzyme
MIANQWFKLRRVWRLLCARRKGVECADDIRLGALLDFNLGGGYHKTLRPDSSGQIKLGSGCWIEQGSVLWAFNGRIVLQPSVFVGPYVVIYGHGGVEIGERTLIAMHCCIVSSNHTVPTADAIIRDQPDVLQLTRIGRDCWLGAGVKVMAGVTIGDGCVIGAGTVVTRDLPAYSIAYGVPARVVGQRKGAPPP